LKGKEQGAWSMEKRNMVYLLSLFCRVPPPENFSCLAPFRPLPVTQVMFPVSQVILPIFQVVFSIFKAKIQGIYQGLLF
jgi:hypothetical protein